MNPLPSEIARVSAPYSIDDVTPFGERAPSAGARLAWGLSGLHARLGLPGKALWKQLGALFPGPFDRSAGGVRLRIYPTENFGDRKIAFDGQLPEAEELDLAQRRLKRGGRFIDIGANVGIYSIRASRRLGSAGRVLAIEPHPGTVRKLAFNLEANGCDNVEIMACALGDREGETRFHTDRGKNVGRSSVLASAVATNAGMIVVPMRKLASLVEELSFEGADLMKIDVEGYEDRVLEPFFDMTPEAVWPRAILLEDVHRDLWRTDIVSLMLANGYRQSRRTDCNILMTRKAGCAKMPMHDEGMNRWSH